MTIAEKIIAAAADADSVRPGDIYTAKLDRLMSNDGIIYLTVGMYNNKPKNPWVAGARKLVFIANHNVLTDSPKTAASQKKMRDLARENKIDSWGGKGVCHQIMMEHYVYPGELVFGTSSHTCTYGVLGAFGIGVGCMDFSYDMVIGTSWVLVPGTAKLNLAERLSEGVYPRDSMLTTIGEVRANGYSYRVMESTGESAGIFGVNDRMVLCNLAVETGVKTGIFEADEAALEYLRERGREPGAVFISDPDAVYAREYIFDLLKIQPAAARFGFVDDVASAKDVCEVKIDEAFLGSYNNGWIEGLWVGTELLKGRKVTDSVGFLVVPASFEVYRQALREDLIGIFVEADAIIMNPSRSAYRGSCQGAIGGNEVLISTEIRDSKGRAGHPSPKVYLGSVAIVTASAIVSEIALASRQGREV